MPDNDPFLRSPTFTHPAFQQLLLASLLCNNADVRRTDGMGVVAAEVEVTGDAVDVGLYELGRKCRWDMDVERGKHARVKVQPFNSKSKLMIIRAIAEQHSIQYGKAEPEVGVCLTAVARHGHLLIGRPHGLLVTSITPAGLPSSCTRYRSFHQHNSFTATARNLWLLAAMAASSLIAIVITQARFFNSVFHTRPVPVRYVMPALGFGGLLLLTNTFCYFSRGNS